MTSKKLEPSQGTTAGSLEDRIHVVRGQRVMLDSDLADLYEVPTKRLNEAVRRNRFRFPSDFMFRLRPKEIASLRSQFATSNVGRGGRRYATSAFTEQGVAMLSSVLRSDRAVAVNVEIMRAFVRLRRLHGEHEDLARRIDELEAKYDQRFKSVFDAIRALMSPPSARAREIGFRSSRVPRSQARRRNAVRPTGGHRS